MQILLIEDDPNLAKFYTRALMRAGHVVTGHRRGDEGLQAARTGSYDLIVLDWYLPGADGITVLRELRIHGLETPILMISGSGEMGRREALDAGADGFLHKPCGLDELITCVASMTDLPVRPSVPAHAA